MKHEVIGSVPGNALGMIADLAHKLQNGAITPERFSCFLKEENLFSKPTSLEEKIVDWQDFYRNVFGMVCDFSKVSIPEHREGFDRLIIITHGLTAQRVYDKCEMFFRCYKFCHSLDTTVMVNNRDATNSAYAVWVRERVESDEEHKNKSANVLKEQEVRGNTLLERLLYELKYFKETRKHLDVQNTTLCSGSGNSVGNIPKVDWDDDRLDVNWSFPDDSLDGLRAREVCC